MVAFRLCACVIFSPLFCAAIQVRAEVPGVLFEGAHGPGLGKHIVLISGDEEYRSEEALPQLGKILARHHGFRCTVLFAVDRTTGFINPNENGNIPGLQALDDADLMIVFTRRRALPDDQMQHIDSYLKTGKPVIGVRTATHAFDFRKAQSKWTHYSDGYQGANEPWKGGFGRLVLGQQSTGHHGQHMHESTRGLIAPGAREHPILRGINDGDIWGPSDVYQVHLPLPGNCVPLVLGQVLQRNRQFDPHDRFYGMRPDDSPSDDGEKNDPMMPVAWTKTYQLPDGMSGRAFTSTMGASVDLVSEGVRRLLVNAVYWCLSMENDLPPKGASVALVGPYQPTKFEFRNDQYWSTRRLTPDDLVNDDK